MTCSRTGPSSLCELDHQRVTLRWRLKQSITGPFLRYLCFLLFKSG